MNGTLWPPERDAALRERYHAMSVAMIAAEFSARFGAVFSRNCIIGRARRIGLSRKRVPKQERRPRQRPRRLPPLPKPQFIRPIPWNQAYGIPVNIVRVAGCRWPVSGQRFETLFCNAACIDRSSYCVRHEAIARAR
jgi:hypothetical protein